MKTRDNTLENDKLYGVLSSGLGVIWSVAQLMLAINRTGVVLN